MTAKLTNQLNDSGWDKMDPLGFPFLSFDFFKTLEESKSIGEGTGWNPIYISDADSLIYTFVKEHSYGEYIFDWDWANFYHEHNIQYYPKLTSMIPFTSVTTPHSLGKLSQSCMQRYEKFYEDNHFSSSHFLFLTESELDFYRSFNYIIRDSFQYHFTNKDYTCFDGFLSDLKNKKAKQIRKERIFDDNIKLNQFTGNSLSSEHAEQMYKFYLSTIENKNAISYLTKGFFIEIFSRLKDNIYYVQASKDEKPIAGALYFYGPDRLYGRYWGATENITNLHFELCFYQGIEICIKEGLPVFEAGAQGEHKISRGFRPVKTYSAHKFKHPEFSNAIEKYIEGERENIQAVMSQLTERLPFKIH
jgi:predicted N-acyltransferase